MRASAYDPPAIPPGFWERAEVRQALRKRDMGTLFRLVKESAGLSNIRLGAAVGLTQGRVGEVINAPRRIAATHVFERIADGLAMPDSARLLLGLSPRYPAALTRPASTRRARPGQDSELLRQITAARSIDTSVIRVLQGETDTIRLLDRRLGAPAVAGKLEAHISQVETGLYYSLLPGNRERLAAVLADACALAGWQAIDMGRLPRAWEHFERATAAAAGLETTCRKALDYAADEVGHGPSGADLPYLALNETHLARWRGNCLVMFGDPQTASELNIALDAMDGNFTRAEAGLHCDLAAALHVRGELDEARRHLKRARELAQATGSARQRRRVAELAKRLGRAA